MRDGLEKVCVLGLGYIGLPTASLLATKGFEVVGVDISTQVVDTINDGRIHIVEPDLDVLVRSAVHSGNLVARLVPEEADVFIIAVPTPFTEGKTPDLSYVENASRLIAPYVQQGNLIILESTSPVGTTDELIVPILRETGLTPGEDVFVAHRPERVLPGRILIELIENDRIVGGIDEDSTQKAIAFYEKFVRGEVFGTTSRTAEMVKLTENTFRDVNIAFANEISMICQKEHVNTWEVISLANRHPRVNILSPGPGVGGHCIAVDPWFIVHRNPELARLIRTGREVNDAKPAWVLDQVRRHAQKFKRPTIGCLGLAFKANVDDLRESPSLDIVRRLRDEDLGELLVCEPNLRMHGEFELTSLQVVLDRADIILLLVDHKPFTRIRAAQLKEKIVIDTRGVLR